MGGLEYVVALHAQRGQVVDIEEPAVVDFIRAPPARRQAVALLIEQLVEQVEAVRIASLPLKRPRCVR